MKQILQWVYLAVAALFLGEIALGLLPEGGMKRFCKFVLGILLVFMILSIWNPDEMPNLELTLEQPVQSVDVKTESYEELILDVYHREMENKNN